MLSSLAAEPSAAEHTLRKVETFVAATRLAKSEQGLRRAIEDICDGVGFQYFALVHHVDFRLKAQGAVVLHNYPDGWIDYFVRHKLFDVDPIHRASRTTSLVFAWSSVPSIVRFTAQDADILRRARLAGIGDGVTVPANVPGEPSGSCSFANAPHRPLTERQLHIAQLIGAFAFEAARRLARARGQEESRVRPLTARQRQCLALVAQGKSDLEIARMLGLGHETVVQHLKSAKERYGVKKRTALAVKALYDGSISFAEVLDRDPYF